MIANNSVVVFSCLQISHLIARVNSATKPNLKLKNYKWNVFISVASTTTSSPIYTMQFGHIRSINSNLCITKLHGRMSHTTCHIKQNNFLFHTMQLNCMRPNRNVYSGLNVAFLTMCTFMKHAESLTKQNIEAQFCRANDTTKRPWERYIEIQQM